MDENMGNRNKVHEPKKLGTKCRCGGRLVVLGNLRFGVQALVGQDLGLRGFFLQGIYSSKVQGLYAQYRQPFFQKGTSFRIRPLIPQEATGVVYVKLGVREGISSWTAHRVYEQKAPPGVIKTHL